ncbi:MAG: hypothetical protein HY884_05060 [Deltaproteobacteria bacterium]|nr:hypothetical protein [Deltaproteobacteria bacterium]
MTYPKIYSHACIKRLIIASAALAALSGCATVVVKGDGSKIDKTQVMELKPGVTDKKTVITAFGEPAEVSSANNEEKLVYIYKEKMTPVYLGGLIENQAGMVLVNTTLEIILKDGVVNSYKYKTGQE